LQLIDSAEFYVFTYTGKRVGCP